jgi:serpin B
MTMRAVENTNRHPHRLGRWRSGRSSGTLAMAVWLASGPLAACGLSPTPGSQRPPVCSAPQGDTAGAATLATGDTQFALSLYEPVVSLPGNVGKNVIVSPYSVSACLSMVYAGAGSQTATQMQSVLNLPGDAQATGSAYATLACQDETDGSSSGNQLAIAQSLWGQHGMPFQQPFLTDLAQSYAAPLQQVDFAGAAPQAIQTIDQWVSDRTQGTIPQLFHQGDLDQTTRLVLVNAIYFKGAWETPFDPKRTQTAPFTRADGSQVNVPTMSAELKVQSGRGNGFTVVELPYQGGVLAMDLLVPDGSLASLEPTLTPDVLQSALAGLAKTDLLVALPRFSFTTRELLNGVLEQMGMTDAFDPTQADFSPIDGARDLSLDIVVHQAFIDVDEKGTTAAGATGAGIGINAVPPEVRFDHPFAFFIRDTRTGSLLFFGRVEDPSAT